MEALFILLDALIVAHRKDNKPLVDALEVVVKALREEWSFVEADKKLSVHVAEQDLIMKHEREIGELEHMNKILHNRILDLEEQQVSKR